MAARGVACAGIVTVDLAFSLDEPLSFNIKTRSRASSLSAGGCALNAARAVARLGGTALLAGRIGDDILGRWLLEEIEGAGIDAGHVTVQLGETTSRSAVLLTPDGERTIINHRSDTLYRTGLGAIDLTGIGAVLADTRWPEGASDLFAAARAAGLPAVIDAEAPVSHAEDALHAATHVAFSDQGLNDFTGRSGAEALAEAADRLGAWVCVTRGPEPVLCHDGRQITEVPAFPVATVDTLGAGDVWHGAFAYGLAEGRSERDAVHRANVVAALKTTRPGSEPLPDLEDVRKFMEETQ